MFLYLLRRLLIVPPTLFVIMFITFALTRIAPGDPVRLISGSRQPDPEVAQNIRDSFGLNGGFFEQFGNYFWGVVSEGDLGPSYQFRSPQLSVQDLLKDRIWVSTQLGLISLALTYLIGIPLGIFAALRRGSWRDPTAIGGLMVFDAIHIIVLVQLIIWMLVFVLDDFLRLFGLDIPSVWNGNAESYIIPIMALTLPGLAGMARFVRVSVLTVMDEDYVRTARAKGLHERVVILRHVVRNAMLPLSTFFVLSIVTVITGSIFIEQLYGIPGVGNFIFDSVLKRDFNLLLGITLLLSTLIVLGNLATDILYVFIDPRIRYGGRG